MRWALILGVAALAVLGAWWALDAAVADAVRQQISQRGLAGRLSFGEVQADLPRRVTVVDVELADALDGHPLVQLGRVDFDLDLRWDDGLQGELAGVTGLGGRVSIVPDPAGLGTMVDTLIAVIETITDVVGEETPGDEQLALPPLLFRDIDVVLLADSWPLENYPGTRVLVAQHGDDVDATIDFGGCGGRLVLTFGEEGLSSLVTEDLILTPGIVRLIGDPWGPLLARLARPRGRADLVISRLQQSLPDVHGTVRGLVIDSPWVPVSLGPLDLPLQLTAGRLSLTTEPWAFQDGTAVARVSGDDKTLDVLLQIRDATFSEALLDLLPVYGEQQFVHCQDGGQFDLDLSLSWDFERSLRPTVSGSGGFHLQQIDLTQAGLGLGDVVGRLTVEGERLLVPEVTGFLADGGFSGSGSLDLADNQFTLELSLKDLNLAVLQASLAPEVASSHPLAGRVAGRWTGEGRVDRPELMQGRGVMSISAGRFAESRLLTSIRQALTLGPAERRNDQRLIAELSVWNGVLTFDRLSVDLGLLALTGQGQLDSAGELDLALLLMREPDGVLGSLWGFIQRNLIVEVQVTGPLDQVEVAVYPLGVITRPLQAAIDFLNIWRDEDP